MAIDDKTFEITPAAVASSAVSVGGLILAYQYARPVFWFLVAVPVVVIAGMIYLARERS